MLQKLIWKSPFQSSTLLPSAVPELKRDLPLHQYMPVKISNKILSPRINITRRRRVAYWPRHLWSWAPQSRSISYQARRSRQRERRSCVVIVFTGAVQQTWRLAVEAKPTLPAWRAGDRWENPSSCIEGEKEFDLVHCSAKPAEQLKLVESHGRRYLLWRENRRWSDLIWAWEFDQDLIERN